MRRGGRAGKAPRHLGRRLSGTQTPASALGAQIPHTACTANRASTAMQACRYLGIWDASQRTGEGFKSLLLGWEVSCLPGTLHLHVASMQHYPMDIRFGRLWKGPAKEWLSLVGGLSGVRGLYGARSLRSAVARQLLNNDPSVQQAALKCLKVGSLGVCHARLHACCRDWRERLSSASRSNSSNCTVRIKVPCPACMTRTIGAGVQPPPFQDRDLQATTLQPAAQTARQPVCARAGVQAEVPGPPHRASAAPSGQRDAARGACGVPSCAGCRRRHPA